MVAKQPRTINDSFYKSPVTGGDQCSSHAIVTGGFNFVLFVFCVLCKAERAAADTSHQGVECMSFGIEYKSYIWK